MHHSVPTGIDLSGTPQQIAAQRHKFIIKLAFLISGGMFIDGFVLGGMGTVMPAITKDLSLTLFEQGLIGASALIGIFLGGPLGGYLADKVGRKPMFTIDLATFLVGSVLQFVVTDAWQLFTVRVIMGMAIGADYAIGWPLLAEFAPARVRGKLLSVQEVGWYIGFLLAYTIGWAFTIYDIAGWNVILGLSTVPTIIVLLMRLGTPESPRWLISVGRRDEALALAAQYMEEDEQADLRHQGENKAGGFAPLFSAQHLRSTLFVSIFWVCCVTPYFAIGTFAPVVLEHLGLQDGLTGGLALNFLALLGVFFTTATVERLGRRKLAIAALVISTISLAVVAATPTTAVIVIVAGVLIFAFANAIGNCLTGVYPAEVFPTEVRGTGVGFATAISRIGAAAGTFFLPTAMEKLGISGTMYVAAGISLFGAVVTVMLAPETAGRLLGQTAKGAEN
ncbi:MAG: MFS transporter [Novosphingobium sp.]|uniref:MFS transporter n=1 Tax=Novosphingobium sp. TaxID=1874826 RepID=UPI003B9B0441